VGIANEPVAVSHHIGRRCTSMDILGSEMWSASGLVVGSSNAQAATSSPYTKNLGNEGRMAGRGSSYHDTALVAYPSSVSPLCDINVFNATH
jgi:hypothetical protein